MIRKPTVIVLGAGASAPYGFPSGRGLLLEICYGLQKEHRDSGPHLLRRNLLDFGFREHQIDTFRQELELSMQPSVDAFLEQRLEYVKIGKAAIASSLIRYENAQALYSRGKLKWYEYLFNQMGARRDEFSSNQLSIVTFNYDRSLENFLFTALTHSYGASPQEAVDLFKAIPIVHVYGQLGKLHLLDRDGRRYTSEVNKRAIEQCIAEIKIIPEASEESDELRQAQELISQAKVVCFLGFGYHPMNLQRLRINQTFRGERLMGSAYGLERGEQRRATSLFKATIRLGDISEDALSFLRRYPVFD